MACRDAYQLRKIQSPNAAVQTNVERTAVKQSDRLLFGVNSKVDSNDVLQNNLTLLEWVERNKIFPNFWGRNITGENSLTKEEIHFLHSKGCRIAAIYNTTDEKLTEEQGKLAAKNIDVIAYKLGIPANTAIFMEIDSGENITTDYMLGFSKAMISEGYIPGFKANTDAKYDFDREYSRGIQSHGDVFEKCLVWATSPTLPEYDGIKTSHLIHPDTWLPFAPSGITRKNIAIWEYGTKCHPIYDNSDKETFFDVNLVRDVKTITKFMF